VLSPSGEKVPVDNAKVEAVAEALEALGSAYRGDWSDFDGRSLRDELGALATVLRSPEPFDLERWYASEWICPVRKSWAEFCQERAEGVGSSSCDHIEAIYERVRTQSGIPPESTRPSEQGVNQPGVTSDPV
jgi:hypothetical protein